VYVGAVYVGALWPDLHQGSPGYLRCRRSCSSGRWLTLAVASTILPTSSMTPRSSSSRGAECGPRAREPPAGRFGPQQVREKTIPRPDRKVRSLGIPTTTDRVVQAALKLVLDPIFGAGFQPCSSGSAQAPSPGRDRRDPLPRLTHPQLTRRPTSPRRDPASRTAGWGSEPGRGCCWPRCSRTRRAFQLEAPRWDVKGFATLGVGSSWVRRPILGRRNLPAHDQELVPRDHRWPQVCIPAQPHPAPLLADPCLQIAQASTPTGSRAAPAAASAARSSPPVRA
jgi:hypothetical protein